MKYKKLLLFLLSVLCAGMLSACGNKQTMNEEDVELVESIAASVAESVVESVAESVVESVAESMAESIKESVEESLEGLIEDSQTLNDAGYTDKNSDTKSANNKNDTNANSPQTTPIGDGFAAEHGALHLDGTKLVDQNNDPIQLYGMSTHGIAWYPDYVSYDTFQTLRDDWNTNCVRLAMYTAEYGGYCTGGDQNNLKALICTGVDAATDLGMYAIIDWHVLQDQDPNVYKEQALAFFKEMSETYADHTNVLYEICNEPNGYATWDSVKSYAEEVIPVIRDNDPDAIIIVGTPTWSQDIDQAKSNSIDEKNVMYAMHFYAGTHKDVLWNRLDSCVQNGLPVFISEFGMCDASGNGGNDFDSTRNWFHVIERYNLSFCCWNLANKNESSSVISSSCSKTSGWSEDELSEAGKWIRDYFRGK